MTIKVYGYKNFDRKSIMIHTYVLSKDPHSVISPVDDILGKAKKNYENQKKNKKNNKKVNFNNIHKLLNLQ